MSGSAKNSAVYWTVPAICVVGGLAYLVSAWAGGRPMLGVSLLAIMLAVGAAIAYAGRRSETVRGLLDRRDERIAAIDLKATAVSGTVMVVAVLIGAVAELARGHSGAPFTWLAAIGGVAYAVSVVVGRVRS